jgi:hypothetical protein
MAPLSPDEAQLGELVKTLDVDRTGYSALVADALELCASRDFRRLHVALSYAPKQHGRLDASALHRLKALTEENDMQNLRRPRRSPRRTRASLPRSSLPEASTV